MISRNYAKVSGILGSGQGTSEADQDGLLSCPAEFAYVDGSGQMVEGLSGWKRESLEGRVKGRGMSMEES